MSPETALDRKGVVRIAADGAVIGAGLFAIMMGISFGMELAGLVPAERAPQGVVQSAMFFISWLFQVSTFALGPIATWYLVQGRLGKRDALPLVLGFVLAGVILAPVFGLGPALQWLVARFSDSQYGGAIAYLVLISLVFAAAVVWRLISAVRDLTGAKERRPLDIAQLVSAVAALVFVAVVVVLRLQGTPSEEAAAFLLLAAYQTASVMAVASMAKHFIDISHAPVVPASPAGPPSASV